MPIINCDAVDNVTISDLSIDGGGADLIDATGTGTGTTGFDGISIADGTFNVVRNCWIKHCKSRGIALTSSNEDFTTSYGHRIEGCYVGDNVSKGIYLQANGAIITNNQINHNGEGIFLYSLTGNYGASVNIITNNHVRLSLYNGIEINAASADGTGGCMYNVINHNIVYNSSKHLNLESSNIRITGTKALYNVFEANFLQKGAVPQPIYGFYSDNLNNYNFFQGNYAYLGGATAWYGGTLAGAGQNHIRYNYTAAAPTFDQHCALND